MSDWVGMIVQDLPAYYAIDSMLRKAKVKLKHRVPLTIGLSYMMSFDETEEDIFVNSEQVKDLKHILNVLPDTPEDQLIDDVAQLTVGYGLGKLFQGLVPALKFIKKNTKAETLTDIAQVGAGGSVIAGSLMQDAQDKEIPSIPEPINPNEKPIIDVSDPQLKEMGMSPAALQKLLGTKAGEVLPSLKKFGSKLFEKKTTSRFSKLAEEGKVGKDWYKQSGDNILKYVGGDKKAADQFAQLLAIYSPQKPIPTNTQFAIKAWNRFKSGQKIWDGEILEKAKLPENLNITQTNKSKKDLLAKYGGID